MRSIGKVKIRNLKQIVAKLYNKGLRGYALEDVCKEFIPDDWYDTWEMAHQEIDRIISDEVTELTYRRI